jgi:hypothetical protein
MLMHFRPELTFWHVIGQLQEWLKSKLSGGTDANHGSGSEDEAPSLYDQLGGEAAVQLTVENFYKRVLRDPQLMPFFVEKDMDYIKRKLVRERVTFDTVQWM